MDLLTRIDGAEAPAGDCEDDAKGRRHPQTAVI